MSLLLLFFLAITPTYVRGNPGAHVTVTNSPVTVGQPIYITFGTDPGDLGNAAMLLTERETEAGILWHSDPLPIDAGMQYRVSHGISTPRNIRSRIADLEC